MGKTSKSEDKLSQPRGAQGGMMTKYHSRWNPGTEKGHLLKCKEIRINCGIQLMILYQSIAVHYDECTILM